VAMHDASAVGCIQSVRYLERKPQHLGLRECSSSDHGLERLSRNQFHRDEVGLLFRECIEDRDDIRMIQGRSNTRFAKESLPGRRSHEPGFHCLERYETTQVQVPGLEDFAHRAFANPLNDFEMTNFLSNRYQDHEEVLL